MLYDDKLDEKITPEFYDQKFKQYAQEKNEVVASIKKHSNAQNQYFELGIGILELSQKGKEIFRKAPIEQKKTLLNLVFSNLTLNEGKLRGVYNLAFEILASSVKATNDFFEPSKNGLNKAKTSPSEADFATLLPKSVLNLPVKKRFGSFGEWYSHASRSGLFKAKMRQMRHYSGVCRGVS